MSVLIAGGGIGGLATAIALARHDIPSHVLEQADAFSEVGAGIQIGPNGMRVLAQWGVEKLLEGKGATPACIRIYDGLEGTELNKVPLGAFALERYGAPYRVFHRAEIQEALLKKARSLPQITISTGSRVKNFTETENGVRVQLVAGEEQHGELLIGADGVWSRIRQMLYPEITPSFVGKSAWRAIIPRVNLPSPFDRLETGLWMAPNAHLVHYPVMGGEMINVVAVISEQFNKEGWTTPGHAETLLARYKDWAPPVHDFLKRVKGWQKWALHGLKPVPRWSRGRVALLGDAAHPPIPFLAQGGVMAIEDAFVLARTLKQYDLDPARAYPDYEKQRRKRAYKVMERAVKLGEIYHMSGFMRQARNMVLKQRSSTKLLAGYDWLYGHRIDGDIPQMAAMA